jgi:hypothetical protein
MKQTLLLALSLVALLFSHARSASAEISTRSARANDMLNFQPNAPMTAQVAPKQVHQPARQSSGTGITFSPARSKPKPVSEVVPFRREIEPAREPLELFQGGSDSLVAKAVGSAEGTRTPEGGRTWAYFGHSDPGNRKWNLGSFSYQHEASSPEDADERQLLRLQRQFDVIREIASSSGLTLSLEEQLNAIDLANQAPLAALQSGGGYVDRLVQAYAAGYSGSQAVLWARTYSYVNPATNQWDAPGLGNTETSISRDQQRRQAAIAEAVTLHRSLPTSPQPLARRVKNNTKQKAEPKVARDSKPPKESLVSSVRLIGGIFYR